MLKDILEIVKTQNVKLILIITLISGLIFPGVLAIYGYFPIEFMELDIWRIILLSAALGTPFYILSSINVIFKMKFFDNLIEDKSIELILILGGIETTLIMSSFLGMAYFFKNSFREYILSLVIVETIYTIWNIFKRKK